MQGKVIRINRGIAEIDVPSEGVFRCAIRKRLRKGPRTNRHVIAVGDNVEFLPSIGDDGVVEQVLPRESKLSRPDSFRPKIEHVMIANLDLVCIVTTVANPPFNASLVDRYSAAILAHELQLLIVANKTDLGVSDEVREQLDSFEKIGFKVLLCSATTGEGLDELKRELAGKTSVFTGHSGVGKSTLISTLVPHYQGDAAPVSDKTGKGRHTTSHAQLVATDFGGYIADTPGLKMLGIWGVPRDELSFFFPDIAEWKQHCRFNNCLHRNEPGCAVIEALRRGDVLQRRYDSYLRILKNIIEMEENVDPHMRKDLFYLEQ